MRVQSVLVYMVLTLCNALILIWCMRSILRFVFLTCKGDFAVVDTNFWSKKRSEMLSNCFLALRYKFIIQGFVYRDEEVSLSVYGCDGN